MSTQNIQNLTNGQMGYQVPGSPAPAGWQFTSGGNAGAVNADNTGKTILADNGRTVADLTSSGNVVPSGTVTPTSQYENFTGNIAKLIDKANIAYNSSKGNLQAGKANLTNLSLAPNGVQSANPQVFSSDAIAGQKALASAFNPALGSISDQMNSMSDSLSHITDYATGQETALKPVVLSAGQSMATPGGTVVIQGQTYAVNPDPLHPGQFISTPQQSLSNPNVKGSGTQSGGDGSGTNTSVVGNSDPYMVALTRFNGGGDPDYANKVLTKKKSIDAYSPQGATADSIDQYISTYGKAPVNGTMIMETASHFGMDASWLAAQLALESHFGMTGESPANNNPGGLKFVNQPGAVQGSEVPQSEGGGYYAKFKSPSDGLFAFGDLMKRTLGTGNTHTASATGNSSVGFDPKGNAFSPEYTDRVQKLSAVAPLLIPYVTAGPGGVAFIAADRASAGAPGLGALANLPGATATGLPVDSDGGLSQQLDGLNSIALQQQTMETLIKGALNNSGGDNSLMGHFINSARSQFNTISQNDQTMTALTAYTSSVLAAAAEIKNLVGGAGSGVRITGFEITNQQAQMPQAGDSYQQAMTKLNAMNFRLAQALHTVFPDYLTGDINNPNVVQPQGKTVTQGGTTGTTKSGLTYTIK